MKITSTLLTGCLVACSFFTKVSAQALFPVSLDEKVQHSTLITEGTVVSKSSFWNPAHTMIFTSNKVKLHKVFKGAIHTEFIEVLTQGGTVGNDQVEASDLAELAVGEIGLFFCHPNSINLRNSATNSLLWDIYSSAQGFIRYDLASKVASAPFAEYANIVSNLYPAVTERTNLSFTNLDPQFVISPEPQPQSEVLGITSFSPTSVAAGATGNPALNLLTITGTDFGTASGSAAILFDDANNGTGGTAWTTPYNDPLVVSWTNTQIQVRVPSRAGTGTFQVRDAAGNVTNSPSQLNVLYSILTASFTGFTGQSTLMSDDVSGGYTILYSTSTAGNGVDLNSSPVKATFQRALNTWKQINGANITEGGNTTSQVIGTPPNYSDRDGLNVIMFDNNNTLTPPLAAGVLAVCYSFNSTCTPVGSFPVRKTEFDIVIRNAGVSTGSTTFENGPCYPTFPDIDMETVLLHELGHAINLGHINDDYQFVSGSYPQVNPGKLMNYAVLSGVARKSPDWAAYAGAQYNITPKGANVGTCIAPNAEMVPLATITEPKDECPSSFPATPTPNNTLVSFDLVHATSNKNVDPQFTAVNCAGTGTPVTNTAYYAIRTGGNGGTLNITVNGYATDPAAQAACANAGVKLALYQVSNCPAGQAYPAPVACRTFNADGALAAFTGLTANTNYLIFVDGNYATKATFSLLLNGAALPVRISNFNGLVKNAYNDVTWKLDLTAATKTIILEAGNDGTSFTQVFTQTPAASADRIEGSFQDFEIADKKYYRLKIINTDGSVEYSSVLLLRREVKANTVIISPNPANDHVNILVNRDKTASLTINLIDATGKKLLTKTQLAPAGNQTIQLNNLEKLSSGNYIIQIWDGEKATTHKLVKQ